MTQTTETIFSSIYSNTSPKVYYTATYTATRESEDDSNVSITITLQSWLPSSSSSLGSGIKLTAGFRVNSGSWKTVVIKTTSDVWSGTTKHSSTVTLTCDTTEDNVTIDFYTTRNGSTYTGTAGVIGSTSSPNSYSSVSVPEYVENKPIFYKLDDGKWYTAYIWTKIDDDTWIKGTTTYIKADDNETWYHN